VFIIREATADDVPAIFAIRTAVKENDASMQRLAELGITPESVGEALKENCKGWVAQCDDVTVGFSIADRTTESIWALFILPEYEARGIGRALMKPAVEWLRGTGSKRIWLTTGPETRAAGFYRHLGWTAQGLTPKGEMKFEKALEEQKKKDIFSIPSPDNK
jgi:GNAT superfamily N-acetyltransferase